MEPYLQQLTAWRRHLHQHPELSFEEVETSRFIAEEMGKLKHASRIERLTPTSVVVVFATGKPGAKIGLRADIDALPIQEERDDLPFRSVNDGKMHACGHDGHTAMLLGAAEYLSATRDFAGSVVFIFQPAEENVAGGKRMCDEGLFTRFPVDSVYALHNWPELPAGHIAVHEHEVMASFDLFDIDIHGQGCHGAMPHLGIDSIAIAAQTISALQHIVSRNLDSAERAVVSVTQIHGGDTYNILPGTVRLSGGTRAFRPEIRDLLETNIRSTASGIAAALGGRAEIHYQRRYPPTRNHPEAARHIYRVAQTLIGAERVQLNPPPSMAAEDFAIMLQERPGAYIWLGNGKPHPAAVLHSPNYDFNDDILATGASLWIALAQAQT